MPREGKTGDVENYVDRFPDRWQRRRWRNFRKDLGVTGFDRELILPVRMSRILEISLNLGKHAFAKASASGVRSPFASVNGMALAFA